ncbi:hypothetical protein [Lonepinella sp. MS14436]|uniref:hypothetical protein n=1 Tax=Lonepinella sp. MS14436 TaxID=3003619 RepID=UPI0036DBC735
MIMMFRFFPEFFCYSIWLVNEDGTVENISANELPITSSLKKEIEDWEREYDSIYNDDYPLESDFRSIYDKISFQKKGDILFKRLQEELPKDFEIFSNFDMCDAD